MNSSGQASSSLSSPNGNDVNLLPKGLIQLELKSYLGVRASGPATSNVVRSDDSWKERRAALWKRLDWLIQLESLNLSSLVRVPYDY